jgi:ubiquinone/menaquinone biosynthesis C-methylase UbiE
MFKRKVETHQDETFVGLESARAFAESAEKSAIRYQAFLDRLKTLDIQGKYLEVGAGAGNLAARIAQSNTKVEITALEISADMITVGEELVRDKGVQNQIQFVQGDAVDPKILHKLGQFDLIYSTYAFHHWNHPRQVIDNLTPILRKEGILYFYDLRRVWWLYWLPSKNGFIKSIRASYLRNEIEEMLRGCALEGYEIHYEFPFMQSIIIRK